MLAAERQKRCLHIFSCRRTLCELQKAGSGATCAARLKTRFLLWTSNSCALVTIQPHPAAAAPLAQWRWCAGTSWSWRVLVIPSKPVMRWTEAQTTGLLSLFGPYDIKDWHGQIACQPHACTFDPAQRTYAHGAIYARPLPLFDVAILPQSAHGCMDALTQGGVLCVAGLYWSPAARQCP